MVIALMNLEPQILEAVQAVGISISAGQHSDLLIKQQKVFHAESDAVRRAGRKRSPWHHLESTGTRVHGINQHGPLLCHPLDSFSCTTPNTNRRSMLRVFQGGGTPGFCGHAKALAVMEHAGVRAIWIAVLRDHLQHNQLDGQIVTEEQVDAWLCTTVPTMGPTVRKGVNDAIAASPTRTASPIVSLFLCDEASPCNARTAERALCWIHDCRHDKKLLPRFSPHVTLVQECGEPCWLCSHDR